MRIRYKKDNSGKCIPCEERRKKLELERIENDRRKDKNRKKDGIDGV